MTNPLHVTLSPNIEVKVGKFLHLTKKKKNSHKIIPKVISATVVVIILLFIEPS